jgi:Omp85 superfamily domain/Calcineurin-like phosphoesterase
MNGMFKIFVLCVMVLCAINFCAAQNKTGSNYTVFLIGDCGEPDKGLRDKNFTALKADLQRADSGSCILFLGDNIYNSGMPAPGSSYRAVAEERINAQVKLLENFKGRAFFIPGNHDWNNGKTNGVQQLKNEEDHILALQNKNIQFLPSNGCPGPTELPLADNITLVMMDSQWWLQQNGRPGVESDCDCKTEDQVLTALKDIVYRNRDKLLIFAAHHPFKTYGKHGGYYTLKQHIFPLTEANENLYIPLPVLGSIYPIVRGVFGNIQDVKNPVYKKMIQSVDEILTTHPYCIRVAGHEHNLQLIQQNNQQYIVSGSGCKTSQVKKGKGSIFAAAKTGYAVLNLDDKGGMNLLFNSAQNNNTGKPLYAAALRPLPTAVKTSGGYTKTIFPDSVLVAASSHYGAGGLKRWLLGSNYRKEWGEKIKVRVIDITKEKGGLKPLKRGGGKQTKSLRLEDAAGKQYVLRSIDKAPDKALPEAFRETFAKDLVKDGISSSYPYAALSIPPLAAAAGVPHTDPVLVFVPDDPALGIYQADFANTLCLFEERDAGLDKSYSTGKVVKKLEDDNDNRINQEAVLQARLLDMFIMDFDRHEDQWQWGVVDNGKGKTYYPVPRDRDQPFFINTGFLPRIVSRPWIAPQLQGFAQKAHNINTFNFAARNFDRSFLNELTVADWGEQAMQFVNRITYEVINRAVLLQPQEIYKYSGAKIAARLNARRNYLVKEAQQYARFLAREVSVTGSDKKELFDITRLENGSVLVKVYKVNKSGDTAARLYQRLFIANETKEIRLYGLGGDDQFWLHGSGGNTIKVRIIGGGGNDVFKNDAATAAGKTVVYDLSTEQNVVSGSGTVRQRFSDKPEVNSIDRLGYKYNILAPFLSASFNPDDGLFLGASIKYTKQGFRKKPFAAQHKFSASHALATKAFNFKYNLELNSTSGKRALVFDADVKAPNNVTNFFSIGNESVFDKSNGKKINYYRTRFNLGDFALLMRFKPAATVTISAGPTFQFYSIEKDDNKNRFISLPSLNGLDSASLFKAKRYGGAMVSIGIDNRNDKVMPSRGINWQSSVQFSKGLNSFSKNITRLNSDLSLFTSFNRQANLVIATRIGGGINYGGYEFFQAQYLSGTENLRGFRKYRFAGDKMLYSNTELRIKLGDFKTYFFPGSTGLLLFSDVGRVWVKGEQSGRWHHGYGGGLWFAPLKRFVITASYANSSEGGLPVVAFGFQF